MGIKVNDFVKIKQGQFHIFQVMFVTENGVYDVFGRFYSFYSIEKLSDKNIHNLGLLAH